MPFRAQGRIACLSSSNHRTGPALAFLQPAFNSPRSTACYTWAPVGAAVHQPDRSKLERVCQIAEWRLVVRLQGGIALGKAGKNRQVISPGDEAQDRRRVIERMVDRSH